MGNNIFIILCKSKEAEGKNEAKWLITKKADHKAFAHFLWDAEMQVGDISS